MPGRARHTRITRRRTTPAKPGTARKPVPARGRAAGTATGRPAAKVKGAIGRGPRSSNYQAGPKPKPKPGMGRKSAPRRKAGGTTGRPRTPETSQPIKATPLKKPPVSTKRKKT